MKNLNQGFHRTVRPVFKMISQIGIVSLVSALAAISFPVLCKQMESSPLKFLDFGSPCKLGKVSGVTFSEISTGGVLLHFGLGTCMLPSECNMTSSMTIHNGYIRTVNLCCRGRDCHLTRSEFLQRIGSSQPNGLVCSSCSSDRSIRCCTSDTVQCTGDETMCAYHYVTVSGSRPAAKRGCATQSYCDHGNYSRQVWSTVRVGKTICTKAQATINVNQLQPLCVP